jgi:hypothetical protein
MNPFPKIGEFLKIFKLRSKCGYLLADFWICLKRRNLAITVTNVMMSKYFPKNLGETKWHFNS